MLFRSITTHCQPYTTNGKDNNAASCEVVITTNCQPYTTNGTDINAALYSTAVETSLSEYDTFIRCKPNKW